MKKRILIFALAIFTLLTLTSCGKKFTVTFNADGGTLAGEAQKEIFWWKAGSPFMPRMEPSGNIGR